MHTLHFEISVTKKEIGSFRLMRSEYMDDWRWSRATWRPFMQIKSFMVLVRPRPTSSMVLSQEAITTQQAPRQPLSGIDETAARSTRVQLRACRAAAPKYRLSLNEERFGDGFLSKWFKRAVDDKGLGVVRETAGR
jgi:hypothetical protein